MSTTVTWNRLLLEHPVLDNFNLGTFAAPCIYYIETEQPSVLMSGSSSSYS